MSADSTPGPEALARHYAEQATAMPASLEAFWMPFTANKQFKAAPRLLASASGMYYKSVDGREVLMPPPACGAATPDIRARASWKR